MEPSADPLEMVERVAAGDIAPEVGRWLRKCVSAWLAAGGEVPLERCMRLPNTPKRMQQAQRNEWIRRAALLTGEAKSFTAAQQVEEALSRFLSRGAWPHVRHLSEPPAGLSKLSTALFHVARLNDGESLSAKQIHRVIGRDFSEKCPPATSMIKGEETQFLNHHQEKAC